MTDLGRELQRRSRGDCFLPERRYFVNVLVAVTEALAADRAGLVEAYVSRPALGPLALDDDLDRATAIAIAAELSGAEAERLAIALHDLGAESAETVVAEMRAAYGACVRDLHAHGRLRADDDLLVDLVVQLVNPIRELPTAVASLATMKVIVELLAHVEMEIDAWTGPLYIRLLHSESQLGAVTALRALIADFRTRRVADTARSLSLESQLQLEFRDLVDSPRHPPEQEVLIDLERPVLED